MSRCIGGPLHGRYVDHPTDVIEAVMSQALSLFDYPAVDDMRPIELRRTRYFKRRWVDALGRKHDDFWWEDYAKHFRETKELILNG